MAILIDPDSGRASPLTARMLSDVSSSSSCSSDDVEEGGGYSSQDEAAVDVSMTPSKFVVSSDREGKRPTRRRSQCEQLSCRSRRQLVQEALRRDASRPTAPRSAPPPVAFRRWSAGPPDAVQFHSSTSSYPLKTSAKNHKRSNLLTAFLAIANLLLVCAVIVQRIELIAHREEIAIANQHRGYMDLAKASLQQQLSTREASVKQYEHTQDRMTRLHADMAERVGTLKEELEEARVELERLREVERVAYAGRAAPDDM